MIDRTLLTEALDNWTVRSERLAIVGEAARLLLDFPTGQQVEAAVFQLWPFPPAGRREDLNEKMRAALEAVRDTMIGDG